MQNHIFLHTTPVTAPLIVCATRPRAIIAAPWNRSLLPADLRTVRRCSGGGSGDADGEASRGVFGCNGGDFRVCKEPWMDVARGACDSHFPSRKVALLVNLGRLRVYGLQRHGPGL